MCMMEHALCSTGNVTSWVLEPLYDSCMYYFLDIPPGRLYVDSALVMIKPTGMQ